MSSMEKGPSNGGDHRGMVRESSSRGIMARARELVRSSSSRIVSSSEVAKDLSERRVLKEASSRREGSGRRGSGLGASSCHEPRVSSTSGRSRRAPPTRHVSSDNMENVVRSARNRDDLVTATMHGHGNISRVRNPRKPATESQPVSQRSSKTGVDRRSHMKRAMSRENVKPPEEYGPNATASSNAHSTMTTNMGLYGGNSPQPRRGRRRPVQTKNEGHDDEDETVEHLVETSDEDDVSDSDEDSFAGEDDLPKQPQKRSTSLRPLRKKVPARRDLMSLLRDRKTIQLADMEDRGNRRILHFFMYQHTLGIDLNELQVSVDQDLAMNGAEALRRPPLPLYVEPAN
jgi:hypothetical protein